MKAVIECSVLKVPWVKIHIFFISFIVLALFFSFLINSVFFHVHLKSHLAGSFEEFLDEEMIFFLIQFLIIVGFGTLCFYLGFPYNKKVQEPPREDLKKAPKKSDLFKDSVDSFLFVKECAGRVRYALGACKGYLRVFQEVKEVRELAPLIKNMRASLEDLQKVSQELEMWSLETKKNLSSLNFSPLFKNFLRDKRAQLSFLGIEVEDFFQENLQILSHATILERCLDFVFQSFYDQKKKKPTRIQVEGAVDGNQVRIAFLSPHEISHPSQEEKLKTVERLISSHNGRVSIYKKDQLKMIWIFEKHEGSS